MNRFALALAVAAVAGCGSSAPYTLPAAVLNTAVAAGASLERRAAGECFSPCTHGTVCNPRTGYCESPSAAEVCDQGETGMVRCVPVMGVTRQGAGEERPPNWKPGAGVSPATGRPPPPPSDASPKAP